MTCPCNSRTLNFKEMASGSNMNFILKNAQKYLHWLTMTLKKPQSALKCKMMINLNISEDAFKIEHEQLFLLNFAR